MLTCHVMYSSGFTVNSYDKVIFNSATARNVLVFYCNCFEVTIMVISFVWDLGH